MTEEILSPDSPPSLAPSVGAIFEDLIPAMIAWVGDNAKGLLVVLASYFAVMFVLTMGLLIALFILLGGGVVLGIGVSLVVQEILSEEAAGVTLFGIIGVGYLLYFLFIVLLNAVLSLVPAGVLKTFDRKPGEDWTAWAMAPLACFNGRDAWRVVVAQLLVGSATFVGLICCVLPGIVVGFASVLVLPAVVLDGLGPVAAIERAWGYFLNHVLWHVLLVALLSVVTLCATFVPLVGHVVAPMLSAVILLHFYRVAFPKMDLQDGP